MQSYSAEKTEEEEIFYKKGLCLRYAHKEVCLESFQEDCYWHLWFMKNLQLCTLKIE